MSAKPPEEQIGRDDQDNPAAPEGSKVSVDEQSPPIELELRHNHYAVSQLTLYGFLVDGKLPDEDPGFIFEGSLHFAELQLLGIEFRARQRDGESTKCTFSNLSLEQRQQLIELLDSIDRPTAAREGLAALSYDQLASGRESTRSADPTEKPRGAKKSVKTFAVLALGLGMLGILTLAAAFMRMQYSLSVTNASLVGNYLPINTKIDGEITEVFFAEGADVKRGDRLVRLTNPLIESAAALRQAELKAAQEEVVALEQQIMDFHTKLEVAKEKLSLQLVTTQAELSQAEQNLKIARTQQSRFAPYVSTGAITQDEFDQAKAAELAAQSLCDAKRALIRSVQLSQRATKKNMLVFGERIDDPQSELRAELKIAQAQVQRLQVEVLYAKQQVEQLEVVAPRDGTVFANYRQVGEYLRLAEEAMAISYPGPTWAMGQISAGQAAKVRPGQVVRVEIPALDLKTTGTVASVGHRAVYAKGGYTADFRSGVATDVPIKVTLSELPPGVPSGMRLDMVVKLELGIPWLDEYLGNTLRPTGLAAIDSSRRSQAEVIADETPLVSHAITPATSLDRQP